MKTSPRLRTSRQCRSAAGDAGVRDRSIGRSPAGNIEYGTCGERAVRRGAKGGKRRDLLHGDKASARNLRQHEIDMFLGHLFEDCRFGRGWRYAVHRDVVGGKLLAKRFGQGNNTRLRCRVRWRIRVALFAGDRSDVDNPSVILRDHDGRQRTATVKWSVEIDRKDAAP